MLRKRLGLRKKVDSMEYGANGLEKGSEENSDEMLGERRKKEELADRSKKGFEENACVRLSGCLMERETGAGVADYAWDEEKEQVREKMQLEGDAREFERE